MFNNSDSRTKRRNVFVWLKIWWLLGPSKHGNEPSGNFQTRFADWICQPHHTDTQPQLFIHLQLSFIFVWLNHYYNLPTAFAPLTLLLKCRTLEFANAKSCHHLFQRQLLSSVCVEHFQHLFPDPTSLFVDYTDTTKRSLARNFQSGR